MHLQKVEAQKFTRKNWRIWADTKLPLTLEAINNSYSYKINAGDTGHAKQHRFNHYSTCGSKRAEHYTNICRTKGTHRLFSPSRNPLLYVNHFRLMMNHKVSKYLRRTLQLSRTPKRNWTAALSIAISRVSLQQNKITELERCPANPGILLRFASFLSIVWFLRVVRPWTAKLRPLELRCSGSVFRIHLCTWGLNGSGTRKAAASASLRETLQTHKTGMFPNASKCIIRRKTPLDEAVLCKKTNQKEEVLIGSQKILWPVLPLFANGCSWSPGWRGAQPCWSQQHKAQGI